MSKIVEIPAYDWPWINPGNPPRPLYLNTNTIIEIRPVKHGYSRIQYRVGRKVDMIYTREAAGDLMERINRRED